MRIELGYPDSEAERALLQGRDRRELVTQLARRLSSEDLMTAQSAVADVYVSSPLIDYLQSLLQFSRQSPLFRVGLSPRAGLALLGAARAWAFLSQRDHVLPEDIQAVLPAVVGHRLHPSEEFLNEPIPNLVARLITAVAVS